MADAMERFQNALSLIESGRLAEADAVCLSILEQTPEEPKTVFLRGLIASQQGDADRAIELIRTATVNDPNTPLYYATLGSLLIARGDPADALSALERATALNPDDTVSLRLQAHLYGRFGRAGDAITAFQQLVTIPSPDVADLLALGATLQAARGADAAVAVLERATKLAPDNVLAQNHLASCQQMRGHVGDAITAYQASLALRANNNPATVGLFAAMQTVCDWRDLTELKNKLDAMTGKSIKANAKPNEDPFLNVTHCVDPRRNYEVARLWSADLSSRVTAWNGAFEHPPRDRDRIRIGYLSSDFHNHATSHLMLGLFGAHDRTRFSIHAYSCSPDDGSDYRKRIALDCDAFVDFATVDSISAARRIHDDGIDILIDLKGHTRQNRLEISALRPAAVQVAWLGFPGTSGSDFLDYIVTDDIVTPPEVANVYSEAFVAMPHCYQVNNRDQEIAEEPISRDQAGLPPDAFIFASFNNTYKLEPEMFGIWMEILRELPNAVLWLMPNNLRAAENLRREAAAQEIAPERLIFAEILPKAQHLKRAALADLALDTRIYNGHTTTSDMLWAGVPVVTLKGPHFASRVSASLLETFCLPELITETRDGYRALALDLARSPERLAALRDRTARQRLQSPLFNTQLFARDLERAFEEMWRRSRSAEPPSRIVVADLT